MVLVELRSLPTCVHLRPRPPKQPSEEEKEVPTRGI